MRKIFIWALAAGLIFGILGNMLFTNILADMPGILKVSIYFLVFSFAMIIFLLVGNASETGYTNGTFIGVAFVLCIVFFLVTMLFEFIYEVEGKSEVEPSNNYVFLVDNSGSMDNNDVSFKRYEVLEQIISDLPADSKIGVYTYANDVYTAVPVGTNSNDFTIDENLMVNDGATQMLTCVNEVADEIVKSGENYNIINLTDGIPTDSKKIFIFKTKQYKNALKKCKENGIKISSVGFGYPDEKFLTKVANATGGVYLEADNVDSLYSSISNAISATDNNKFTRTLVSVRQGVKSGSILYAILRILFLSLMGILFSIIKTLAASEQDNSTVMIIISIICCTIGAVIIELFTNAFSVSENISRILFCLLWSITVSPVKSVKTRKNDYSKYLGGSKLSSAKSIGSNRTHEPPKEII